MTTAIVQARMGSSRLPGKVLTEVNGRPLLSYMLERLALSRTLGRIVVATTDRPDDDVIVQFCRSHAVECVRGSENDVLDRYYQCARHVGADPIVRLTSDCPLLDPAIVDEVVSVFRGGGYDYVANTAPPPGTFPDGMDVEVFSFAALERAWREARKPSEREHVTFYFWKNPSLFSIARHDRSDDVSRYRLTVDYPDDLRVVGAILSALHAGNPAFSLEQVLQFLTAHPEITTVNASIAPNQGWLPSLERDTQAGES